ncbi:MAG: ATP-binding cassette domain-containing protein [Mycobacteriaceae bacterium]
MTDLTCTALIPARGVEATLDIRAGEVLALIGPNGSGKSSIAAVIAGLLDAQSATVRIGDHTLTDTSRGIAVHTCDRRVGLLGQDPLLFPHMSVIDNVAFAARQARRRHRSDARSRAMRWLEKVDAADLTHRRPAELSGGEAQRVALGRALAAEPEALILDEPLSGLDVTAAASMRAVLGEVLASDGRPTLLITHDLIDVATLADRVAVLESGRITESGPAAAVLAAPRSVFGAGIAGVNVVRGVVDEQGTLRDAAGQRWHGTGDAPAPGQAAMAVFSPAAIAVYRDRPQGSPRNCVLIRIEALEAVGSAVRVRGTSLSGGAPGLAADVTASAAAELQLKPGEDVWFSVKAQAIAVHAVPPKTGSHP